MEEPNIYDVIIIGGACAGLTAGVYAGRRAMKTLVITKDMGGQAATAPIIENYPGCQEITGAELMNIMNKQSIECGSEIVYDEVSKINKLEEKQFEVVAHNAVYHGRSVIMAFGKTPRSLDIPGEKEYLGRGISYCVTCDGPLFKKRQVAVVGGGNSALEGALALSKICSTVYLVHRRQEFRSEEILVEQLNNTPNIIQLLSYVPTEVKGNGQRVTSLVLNQVDSNETKEVEVDGVFVEIGFTVSNHLSQGLVEIDKLNQIIVNDRQETSMPGIFAAGDVTNSPYKQMVIAAADGSKAALSAYAYVFDGKTNHRDWVGHK